MKKWWWSVYDPFMEWIIDGPVGAFILCWMCAYYRYWRECPYTGAWEYKEELCIICTVLRQWIICAILFASIGYAIGKYT